MAPTLSPAQMRLQLASNNPPKRLSRLAKSCKRDNIARAVFDGGRLKRRGEMQRERERELREELVQLREQHRALDEEIVELEGSAAGDQLLIKRLKKKKLALKDRIQVIEDQLLPDIIA